VYRAGVIGCGFIGVESPDSHIKAYRDCNRVDLICVCDTDFDKRYSVYFVERYVGYLEMVKDKKPDIVSVCTPVETHCQIVCDIAPHVKAIYCEKPIATTLEEADRMIETCHKHGVILQVNHQRRFLKAKMRWSRGILSNGTHAIDLMRQMFGEDWQEKIDLEYVDSMDYPPIFELVINQPELRPILKGVEHLVECLKEGKQSISSGEEARQTLKEVFEYENRRCHNICQPK